MQNPNEDTEWNDVLRAKGIIPPKQDTEITEDEIVTMLEESVQQKVNGKAMDDMTLDELDELEDEEDERILEQYRRQRIAEIKQIQSKANYGEVKEISAIDYIQEVNNAGEGIWVVLHLYMQGIPLCALINQHLSLLAAKFPATKFLKSISTTCIRTTQTKNLPTLFFYFEGKMKSQVVGPFEFNGMNLTADDLEWKLGQAGAVNTTLNEKPEPQVRKTVSILSGKNTNQNDDSSSDDDY